MRQAKMQPRSHEDPKNHTKNGIQKGLLRGFVSSWQKTQQPPGLRRSCPRQWIVITRVPTPASCLRLHVEIGICSHVDCGDGALAQVLLEPLQNDRAGPRDLPHPLCGRGFDDEDVAL